MYDKFGQEYKNVYRYFHERAKSWAKDIGAFRKEENKYDFDIVVYYAN